VPVDPDHFPEGRELLGVMPRIFAGVGSGLAAVVIIAGALWSAIGLLRRRGGGRLAVANLLIAAGTLLISGKALFEGFGDEELAFSAALASGITIVFVGFLLTNTTAGRPAVGQDDRPAALTAGSVDATPAGAASSAQRAP
jgi:hypothetical protein